MTTFSIPDGRTSFYQWDLNQHLIVSDEVCCEVHFCNKTSGDALVCRVFEKDGLRLVDVPNILLQQSGLLRVYAYIEQDGACRTSRSEVFNVLFRPKPVDYIYTETEVLTVERAVEIALEQAKESGDFKGEPFTYDDFTEEQLADLKGKPGYTPVKGVDYFDGKDGKDMSPTICNASGVVPQITDAANRNILNLTVNDDTDVRTVKVIGKNLFNRHYTKLETNIGVTVEWDAEKQEFVFNGTTSASGDIKIVNPLKIDWIPGEKYTVSVRRASGTATLAAGTNATTYAWGIFQDNASKFVRGVTGNSGFFDIYNFTGTAFALDANRNYIFYFQCWRPGTVFNDYRVKIQIEKGSNATDWDAYREESTTLDDVTSLKLQKGFNTIVTVPSADIAVEYVADTKLYIDNKFAELQSAILSMGGNV